MRARGLPGQAPARRAGNRAERRSPRAHGHCTHRGARAHPGPRDGLPPRPWGRSVPHRSRSQPSPRGVPAVPGADPEPNPRKPGGRHLDKKDRKCPDSHQSPEQFQPMLGLCIPNTRRNDSDPSAAFPETDSHASRHPSQRSLFGRRHRADLPGRHPRLNVTRRPSSLRVQPADALRNPPGRVGADSNPLPIAPQRARLP